jgi:hypothetical protein
VAQPLKSCHLGEEKRCVGRKRNKKRWKRKKGPKTQQIPPFPEQRQEGNAAGRQAPTRHSQQLTLALHRKGRSADKLCRECHRPFEKSVSRKPILQPNEPYKVLKPDPVYYEFIGECYVHGMMNGEAITVKGKEHRRGY